MDIVNIIKELRGEMERIDALIIALENIQTGRPRRGRPPKALQQFQAGVKPEKTRKRAAKKTAKSS